ncbi:MAG TPA: acyl-CoA thioesterase II [Intrasporangium sp.]|uniref:acyl-CoA thioesterase n=1 Tax=Intrasporangium sp. TaxID=1925024 RepID=UPI002D76B1AD|nr:acyl-CoA thioesterase II [Intrasporangium sp.]HET7398597.1 acyl-CoA thioesterase II [Intrasporangium sp.]
MTEELHPTPPIVELLEVLDLKELGSVEIAVRGLQGQDASAALGANSARVFEGQSQLMPHGRVFGGQVLAQCVMAAGLTLKEVEAGQGPRPIHSLHGYFMRPGDDTLPIRFAVEEMRDGQSFSTRRVHAIQRGKPIMSMTCSFQERAEGLDHQDTMPEVPGPEGLRSLSELMAGIDHPAARHIADERPVEQRPVEVTTYVEPARDRVAAQNVWMRAVGELPDDPLLHAAVLAYASDYSLLEPVLRRHGLVWSDPRLRVASLDHSMWFHRHVNVEEWLLYTQESPSATSGRGLGIGRMFSRDGRLVATTAQEGMVRVKPS